MAPALRSTADLWLSPLPAGIVGDGVRVLIVINRLQDHGGAEVSTIEILRNLQGDEFQFLAVTLFGDADFAGKDALVESGVDFLSAPPGFFGRLRFLSRVIRSWRPDLVHSSLFDADMAVRIVAPIHRVPVLSSLVNTEFSEEAVQNARSPRKLGIVRLLVMASGWLGVSHFHAISESTAAHGRERLKISPRKITTVPRGRDPKRLGRRTPQRRAASRSALGLEERDVMILNVARREPQKGQVHLVMALERLHKAGLENAKLFIAGRDGSSSEALERAVAELELEDSVTFLGTREDIPDLLCACDVFAFSSLWEGLGGALIEALALEAPIVSYDIAAAREVVHGCGLLVPPGDVGALAEAIAQAIEDPTLVSMAPGAARTRFEERYSTDSMCDAMGALYRRAADLRPPPVPQRR